MIEFLNSPAGCAAFLFAVVVIGGAVGYFLERLDK
jgi:hypothetical protein